ncbi:hypothetical protein [Nocardioides sp. JQ2195]|nr:hypothetical protein [Nocardioides sp. JQ2195]
MRSNNLNGRPTMTWVEVKDADGSTHLEARWSVVSQTPAVAPHAA